jgi:hypothetical protein
MRRGMRMRRRRRRRRSPGWLSQRPSRQLRQRPAAAVLRLLCSLMGVARTALFGLRWCRGRQAAPTVRVFSPARLLTIERSRRRSRSWPVLIMGLILTFSQHRWLVNVCFAYDMHSTR